MDILSFFAGMCACSSFRNVDISLSEAGEDRKETGNISSSVQGNDTKYFTGIECWVFVGKCSKGSE